jgi:hypothetical protein
MNSQEIHGNMLKIIIYLEIQIKGIVRYYFIPMKMATVTRTEDKSW